MMVMRDSATQLKDLLEMQKLICERTDASFSQALIERNELQNALAMSRSSLSRVRGDALAAFTTGMPLQPVLYFSHRREINAQAADVDLLMVRLQAQAGIVETLRVQALYEQTRLRVMEKTLDDIRKAGARKRESRMQDKLDDLINGRE